MDNDALAYTNLHRLSIEATWKALQEAPSGTRLSEILADLYQN